MKSKGLSRSAHHSQCMAGELVGRTPSGVGNLDRSEVFCAECTEGPGDLMCKRCGRRLCPDCSAFVDLLRLKNATGDGAGAIQEVHATVDESHPVVLCFDCCDVVARARFTIQALGGVA